MKNDKLKTLEILKNTYCRLKPSKTSGVGVFAIRNIAKGQNLFPGLVKGRWYKFNTEELKELDKEILKMIDDFFVIEKDGSVEIQKLGLNGMDMSFYLNNSKNPNSKTIDDGLTFIALKKIKKGEEITVAYGDYDHKY